MTSRNLKDYSTERLLISPSLLAADFGSLDTQVDDIARAGAELLHLDVMDGHLVPNLSFGSVVISNLRARHMNLLFDAHLMIEDPLKYAEDFAKAGADHITFHWESNNDPREVIAKIRSLGCTVGISLKPATPAEKLFDLLDLVDLVLVMTVEPGFGGQSFLADQAVKLSEFRKEIKRRNLAVHLEVDGGIDEKTAPVVKQAGANILVAGSSVFRNKLGIEHGIKVLR
ncbi:MAG: ribulose-phosphate 3-epimerase [Victivallaceae bacterium]|nr:ribulose-phosphate 3-epimerase [Victivallaceae bacterium]